MRILITINHPAHVHFFSTVINYLNARGYELAILATDKENSFKLLDELNIEYIKIGKHQDSLIKKLTNFTIKWFKMFHFCLKFQPDISMGIADFYMAQISKILRFYSLIFTDTEHVKHDKFLTFPFADFVLTPKCFEKRIGKNHITYDAYHELTYLNSNFSPDKNLLGDYGILNNEKYVLIRLVSWNAAHDIGYNGLSEEQLNQLINFLEQEYRIFISSEKQLPQKFNKYLINIPYNQIHNFLYFSQMYIGEGATMASEAAILGTPSIYFNELKLGYLEELSIEYKIVFLPKKYSEIFDSILEVKQNGRDYYRLIRNDILESKIDPNQFIVNFIEELKQ